MFDTFKKQNVNFTEVLFSEYYIVPDKYKCQWEKLRALGEELTHCHPSQTLKTMAGLSTEKKKALQHPYPSIMHKIEKYGYDGKQLHHIIRINEFIKNYIAGVPFARCLTMHNVDTLRLMMDAKLNMFPLQKAIDLADKYDEENSRLKDEFINNNGMGCNSLPYLELDNIKVEILRQWFKEQLFAENPIKEENK